MDWEQWLRTAGKRPSDSEEAKAEKTENEIRSALATYAPLQGHPYRIYTKGSYANNTNVRLNYDVDIAVEYTGYFYSDLAFELKGKDQSVVGLVDSTDPYTREEFKRDIRGALVAAFGASAVTPGRIACRIREQHTTLPADVVPCWEYRRYDRIGPYGPVVYVGSRVYPSDGGYIDNFPKIQLERGNAKNTGTGRRYKRTVRAFKKLQTECVKSELLEKELPSYLSECLVYNVDDRYFTRPATYLEIMRNVLAVIHDAMLPSGDGDDWHEVHELKYLFRGTSDWTKDEVRHAVNAVWSLMGFP